MNAQGAYNIRLLGFPGLAPDACRSALQQAFPVDDRQAAEVVQRIPTRVKSSLARADALRFAKVLLKLGADIEIDKSGRSGARVFRAADFSRGSRGMLGANVDLGDILGLDDDDMPLRMPTSGEWPAVSSSEFELSSGGFDDDDDDDDEFFQSYHGANDSGPSLAALLGDDHGHGNGRSHGGGHGANGYDHGDDDSDDLDVLFSADEEEHAGPAPLAAPELATLRSPVEPASDDNPFKAPSLTVARLEAAKRSGLFSLDEISPGAPPSPVVPRVTESGTELRFDQLFPPKAAPGPAEAADSGLSSALPPEDEEYADRIEEQTGHSFRGPTPGPNGLAAIENPSQQVATKGGKLTFSSAALDSVVCPNCGAEQAVAEVCSRCASGLIDVEALAAAEARASGRGHAPSLEVEIVPSGGLAGPRIIDPTPRYRGLEKNGPATTGENRPPSSDRDAAGARGRRLPLAVVAGAAGALGLVLVAVVALGFAGGGGEAVLDGQTVRDAASGGTLQVRFPGGGDIEAIEQLDFRNAELEFREGFVHRGAGNGSIDAWYFAADLPDSARAGVAESGGRALGELLELSTAPLDLRVGEAFPTRTAELPTLEAQVRRNRQVVGRFRMYALEDEVIVTGYVRGDAGDASEAAGLRFLDSFAYSGPAPVFD